MLTISFLLTTRHVISITVHITGYHNTFGNATESTATINIAPYIISIWYIKWAPLVWVVLKLAEMMLTAGLFVKMLKKVEEGVFGKSEEENEESEEDEEGSAEEPVVVRLTEETEAARRKSENKSENKSEEKSEKKSDKESDKDDAEVKTASE